MGSEHERDDCVRRQQTPRGEAGRSQAAFLLRQRYPRRLASEQGRTHAAYR